MSKTIPSSQGSTLSQDMNTIESQAEMMNQQQARTRQRELLSLVLPWVVVMGIAVVVAAVLAANPSDDYDNEANEVFARQLYTDDGYVPPTDDFKYPRPGQEQSYASYPAMEKEEEGIHHHKPVYNEEHPPLFPLTSRDYAGFILAVMGLMVAVSDKKGHG